MAVGYPDVWFYCNFIIRLSNVWWVEVCEAASNVPQRFPVSYVSHAILYIQVMQLINSSVNSSCSNLYGCALHNSISAIPLGTCEKAK